jgi:hypothetical protein
MFRLVGSAATAIFLNDLKSLVEATEIWQPKRFSLAWQM